MPSVSRQSDEHDDIPNPTPEQRHDTSEDEMAVDDHQEQTDNSDDAHDYEASDDYGVYTDVGNQNVSTPTGESVQVFTKVPQGVSKFGRAYIPSYVYNSPYMISPLRRGKNTRPIPRPQIMAYAIDMNTSVDINPLKGLEDSSLFAEFDRWFAGDMTVVRRVQHPRSFFQILLGLASMGWLGDEHIHEYFRLISEKQRQYPNALVQRVTHTDTFFWHTMSKSMTDVDMLLIPINLDGSHWVLARVDFRKNKLSSLDGWNMLGSTTSDLSCGVLTPGKLSQLGVRHNKSPELAIAVFLY
ncbi:hypothetical protein CUMW_176800 [Citrus unshiu]|uniref:Ubiquitin-like protease family profile domain-containing protein n=1 Tax=Citrus unshiu TaxID=55188 RepID=A0A2H5PXL1_CITUN|nr:hypothetical protein CUMW_176800 [Citrus unshiu]